MNVPNMLSKLMADEQEHALKNGKKEEEAVKNHDNASINAAIKVLHLEDMPSDAELVKMQLKSTGLTCEILVVENKADYIKALTDFSPHIILSDHNLPSFDSIEALQILKENGKNIPFVLVTATVSEEYAVRVMREGADDYVLKDQLERLPNAVLNVLEKYKSEADKLIFLQKKIASEANLALINKQMVQYNQIVSHDLRTPVSNIIMIADTIDLITDEEERQILFSNLKKTAFSIKETLNKLVDAEKIKGETDAYLETLLFKDAFDKGYSLLEILAQRLHTEFITDFTRCPSIHYSKIFLDSIFLNLMSNSLKYYSPDRSPVISIKTYKKGKCVVLEYTDNGLGIDIKKMNTFFLSLTKRFIKTKRAKG